MDPVIERIGAWEAAGLLDPATAARLREVEGARVRVSADLAHAAERPGGTSTTAQIFGPSVAIGEMFAYLGGAFILGAFDAFLFSTTESGSGSLFLALGLAAVSAVLIGIGAGLRTGDARRRRATGVAFAVAVAHAAAAAVALLGELDQEPVLAGLVSAATATILAIALRSFHPSVLTQVTLLSSLTGLAASTLAWVQELVVPPRTFEDATGMPELAGQPDPLLLVLAAAAWWLLFALFLGYLALSDARSARGSAAARRVAVTRLWAGLTAVIGLASAVTRSDYRADGEFGRALEPAVGDAMLVVLAAILVERALRRGANTFVYAAALALIIALSDFNFAYLSDTTEAALLIEGIILLGAGFVADRIRRRIDGGRPHAAEAMAPTPA